MGITVYFAGFLLEPPFQRWNLPTFFDSLFSAFLIFSVPLSFFSLINYRYLLVSDIIKQFNTETYLSSPAESEELIRIESQLKKEELFFYPNQFIYAESDGNYIVFHLNLENQIKKRIIRNSISNIEQQLSAIPFLFRSHRAYIVNIRKVSSQKGNTLGYRLKLAGTDIEIPVSRQKTHDFDQILKRYH
jgi:DNA-binding LytR/AlgR family response regulator